MIDLLILAVVVIAMLLGRYRGLIASLVHMTGWIGGLVAAVVCTPVVKTFLSDNTGIYAAINGKTSEKIQSIMTPDGFEGTLPAIIKEPFDKILETVTNSASEAVSQFILTALAFALVILIIKVAIAFLMHTLSVKGDFKVTGVIDGNLGMVFGFVCGILTVFVLLAVALPLLTMFAPEKILLFHQELQSSYVAADLYDNNLVSLMITDLMYKV